MLPAPRIRIAHLTPATLLAILASCWPAIAQAQSAPPAEAPVAVDSSEWRIGPEDLLDIAVWNHAELTKTVPVRPDGRISLPLVQDIKAAGLTPMELRDQLATRLSEYISNPGVSVIVNEIHSFKVSVLGEVKTPGRYELKSRATVLDVLALAEGFTEYASKGRIVVLRQDGPNVRRLQFDFGDAVGNRAATANIPIQPGDIVIVP